ncbi:MAG: hypothetical protein CL942_08550 [Desulfovibrio sp.]|nr:hypothetical protein [Desulfovibrio sp.]|tara:strand:+ start:19890 stop:21371 length:1482 start_codon:yes stop_codon:yes gene_type:complete
MGTGLSVNRKVYVAIYLSRKAVPRRNFGVLCAVGDSDVITGLERIRFYTSADDIADEFGMDSPEYKAAELYFSQKPKPKVMAVGRWIQTATKASLRGSQAVSELATWTAITDGAMKIEVDGVEASLSTLDFSGQSNMNGVASVISTALSGAGQSGATCTWDGSQFVISTAATGATAFMGHATSPTAGTDISTMTGLTEALAYTPVPGYDAETPAECAAALADVSSEWYGLMFATSNALTDEEHIDVAAFIEASEKSRVYGVTISDIRAKASTFTTDLGSRLKALGYQRSFPLYSNVPHAVASVFGRAFTVNFSGSKTTITLAFKDLPGVTPETLKESEAKALEAKNINFFASYDNDTAILEDGVMANGAFFDEVHGTDWLQNAIQTGVWNLLYTSKTKVPQTEDGVTRIQGRIASVLDEGVTNGLIAPGVWNSDGFGQLLEGDFLKEGFYIYTQPINDQAQEEREQRKAPPTQVAIKLAGAIHSVDVQVDVNR